MTKVAIEEYQRQTLKGYAEKVERKGNPHALGMEGMP